MSNAANQEEGANVNFAVHNIYVKDVSFEVPKAPDIFTNEWRPRLDFDIEMSRQDFPESLHEVMISITVKVNILPEGADEQTADKEAGEVALLIEVKQAGIFLLEGVADPKQVDYILATTAPNILFPYVRELVSSMVTRGGFPQLILPPINFEAMYQQHLEQQQQGNVQPIRQEEAANA